MNTLVVVADEAIARILELPPKGGELTPVEELTDPDAHMNRADARRDAHGRRAGGGTQRGDGRAPHALMSATNTTASAGDDELHKEAQGFARRVSERLTELHQERRYDSLHLVAAPRFLGTLRRELKPEVERTVVASINKDLVHLGNDEITQRVLHGGAG
ncbi:host attachment protein [Aquabacterium sp. J223]|uniref:host attachment protein n=1 Tax=Aquabacterium sp. J223 TaxID=2898431 RepID=UPI0021AD7080|nr:host attachment protein [Aquabacterium sp. J223]UUX95167.1 host attachment protein [Aquabacterium sp. J223]